MTFFALINTQIPNSLLLIIILWLTTVLTYVCFNNPDQHRMIEIISHLTKMRFGEEEHNKTKDTKEVSNGTFGNAQTCCCLMCDCLFQPAGGIYSRLEAQFKSQTKPSSDKIPRYCFLGHQQQSCRIRSLIL